MQTAELLQKIRKLEIRTNRMVDEVIGGAYHSVFKGRGIEFDEVREYTPDDDVRDIDWNVSARLGSPYVKKYMEERELNVMLLVDISGSTAFGSGTAGKRELAAECAAMLALSAIRNHDQVGLMLFSDQTELFLPLKSGRRHALRLIREVLAHESAHSGTDVASALRECCNLLTKRSVIFLITDLLDDSPQLEKALTITNRRHDLVILRIADPAELAAEHLPAIRFCDAESGESLLLPGNRTAHERFRAAEAEFRERARSSALRAGVETVDLFCGEEPLATLTGFFRRRSRIGRHHPVRKGAL